MIPRDVSDGLELRRLKKTSVKVFSVENQMKFLVVLVGEHLRAAFILALGTSVREGELLALRWQDVDLKAGIRIEQTVRSCRINFEKDGRAKTQLIFGSPKTDAGRRSTPLPEGVLTELIVHKKYRHTFATRLLEANEHPKVVQEMLGHASIVLTLDTYSHVLPQIKQATAAKLDFLFQEKKPSIKEGL